MKNSIVISNRKLFFIFIILFGYIIYSPMTSNYLTNPDGIILGLVDRPWTGGIDLGRIGIKYVNLIFGKIISPNLMLIMACCILGITVWLLTGLFHIESFIDMALMGVLILLMPTTSSTFTYYYNMVQYILSGFLGVCACYITIKNKKKWIFIIGGCFVTAQLTLYQSYLSVTIVVAMLYLIYMLLEEPVKKVIGMASKLCLMGITGVGLYLILLKVMRVQLSSNRGFDKMGQINIRQLPMLIGKAYRSFIDYFFGNKLLNNSWMHRNFFNFLIVILCIGMLVYLFLRKKMYRQIGKTILFWGLILLLPIGAEIMVIVAPGVDTYGTTGILLVPAMSLIYMSVIFFGVLVKDMFTIKDAFWKRVAQYSYLIAIIPVVWNLVLFTSTFENVMWLNYQGTYSLCGKISERIEEYPDLFTGETKIMIAGNPESGNYPCTYENLRVIVKGTLAPKGLVWQGGWLTNRCYQAIFRNYFNIDYQIVTVDEYDAIIASREYELMGVFPNRDSVANIDGVIVIKLSE